jgi:hypothetical protein
MAIQISIPRKNGGTPLYPSALVYTPEVIFKFNLNIIDVGWSVYADRTERDNGEIPLFTFGTQLTGASISPFTQATLKGNIDSALKALCSAEVANPSLNSGNRIPPRLRDAIILGTIVAD